MKRRDLVHEVEAAGWQLDRSRGSHHHGMGHPVAMQLIDRAGLANAERLALQTELTPLTSLDRVVSWGLRLSPPRMVSDVVIQDEYTHDVVLPHAGERYLVFDTT